MNGIGPSVIFSICSLSGIWFVEGSV